jgi:hypothetical protein
MRDDHVAAADASVTCVYCGVQSPIQGNTKELDAAEPAPPPIKDEDFDQLDGTVYHNVGGVRPSELPHSSYQLRCLLKSKGGELRKFLFTKNHVSIGRAGSDITVDDPLVSRKHAEIERVNDQVILKDLGSTNGTFVNKEKVTVHILKDSDVVRVGNSAMRVGIVMK